MERNCRFDNDFDSDDDDGLITYSDFDFDGFDVAYCLGGNDHYFFPFQTM